MTQERDNPAPNAVDADEPAEGQPLEAKPDPVDDAVIEDDSNEAGDAQDTEE